MRTPLAAVLALFCIATAGCDDAPVPGPGTLTVSLASPNGVEGAARLVLIGPGMGTVSSLDGEVHVRVRGDTMGVILMRQDPGPLRFLLQVEDTTRKPRGSVVQVAGPDNEIRPALMGYRVEVGL